MKRIQTFHAFATLVPNCIVSDVRPIDDMHLGNRSIRFRDCDLSATPAAGRLPDPRHATYAINAP